MSWILFLVSSAPQLCFIQLLNFASGELLGCLVPCCWNEKSGLSRCAFAPEPHTFADTFFPDVFIARLLPINAKATGWARRSLCSAGACMPASGKRLYKYTIQHLIKKMKPSQGLEWVAFQGCSGHLNRKWSCQSIMETILDLSPLPVDRELVDLSWWWYLPLCTFRTSGFVVSILFHMVFISKEGTYCFSNCASRSPRGSEEVFRESPTAVK